MNYPNTGKRAARRAAREATEDTLAGEINALIQKFPAAQTDQKAADFLNKLIRQFNVDFGRLPTEMEILEILARLIGEKLPGWKL